MERAGFLRAFLWDVMLKGATPEEVVERARKITPPRPGSVRVHNDAEEWKADAPSLNQSDLAEGARLFRNHILGGQTIPEHWYGDPDPELMPTANFPELSSRDVSKYAAALGQVVVAAAAGVERGLMTELLALKIIQTVAERLRVEFDAEDELTAARAPRRFGTNEREASQPT